jgi:hypothetical protein
MIRLLPIVLALGSAAAAQAPFTLTGVVPDRGSIDVDVTGATPADLTVFESTASWRVSVEKPGSKQFVRVRVDDPIKYYPRLRKLILHLSGDIPAADTFNTSSWVASFVPPLDSAYPDTTLQYSAPTPCAQPSSISFLCVPASGSTPDISVSGSFTAAGGSKPIYQFELLSNLYSNAQVFSFNPGISAQVEINQNASPPVNRTTFDPDSIQAGLSFQHLYPVRSHFLDLNGIQFDEALPGGEFTRKDPTSNIVAGSTVKFDLRSFLVQNHLTYGALNPLIGIETGHNLNKPRVFDSVPVDLSQYNAIFRGVAGADGILARKSQDKTVDVWSITATYVVRLPATDEPLVKTLHQVTTVQLTDRARHWVEVDGSVSPWSFKYLAINAKYQYGSLPPAFNFVDHSFTIGLSLRASQAKKPVIAP